MAYMDQKRKKEIAPEVAAICKKYGMKASLSVQNHSTLYCNIKSGKLNLIGMYNAHRTEESKYPDHFGRRVEYTPVTYLQVGYYNQHKFVEMFGEDGAAFLTALNTAMNKGNHDKSDIMTDYFDVGWYQYINIGQYDKPYVLDDASK